VLFDLIINLIHRNSRSIQDDKSLREKLQKVLGFLPFVNSSPRHITSELEITEEVHRF